MNTEAALFRVVGDPDDPVVACEGFEVKHAGPPFSLLQDLAAEHISRNDRGPCAADAVAGTIGEFADGAQSYTVFVAAPPGAAAARDPDSVSDGGDPRPVKGHVVTLAIHIDADAERGKSRGTTGKPLSVFAPELDVLVAHSVDAAVRDARGASSDPGSGVDCALYEKGICAGIADWRRRVFDCVEATVAMCGNEELASLLAAAAHPRARTDVRGSGPAARAVEAFAALASCALGDARGGSGRVQPSSGGCDAEPALEVAVSDGGEVSAAWIATGPPAGDGAKDPRFLRYAALLAKREVDVFARRAVIADLRAEITADQDEAQRRLEGARTDNRALIDLDGILGQCESRWVLTARLVDAAELGKDTSAAQDDLRTLKILQETHTSGSGVVINFKEH